MISRRQLLPHALAFAVEVSFLESMSMNFLSRPITFKSTYICVYSRFSYFCFKCKPEFLLAISAGWGYSLCEHFCAIFFALFHDLLSELEPSPLLWTL